jgi:hypothetical protein
MKLEKKHYYYIGIAIVALIAIWYFFLRKKPESKYSGIYGSFGNESGYAGIYGSFGNESGFDKINSLDANLPMIGKESNYAGIYGSFGNESAWVGNAAYNDCHLKCMRAGGSTASCDQKCGRGKTGSAAMTSVSNYNDPGPSGLGPTPKPGPYKGR